MHISVSSEVGHLQGVIVHTPGHEVSLVNPELKNELLFDDIIFEDDARLEHLDMLSVFKAAMPKHGQVFEILDLMADVFNTSESRAYLIEQMVHEFPESNLSSIEHDLLRLDTGDFLDFMIQGVSEKLKHYNLKPSPNLLFTRDLAAVVGSTILLSRAATKTRLRESLLMECVVKYHPLFEAVRENTIRISGHQSIEGGDVLVASEHVVLIGMSERTSFTGLMKAAKGLLDTDVETVLAVDIPKQRSSMHLDTIFTFASMNECVVFPPAISEQRENVVVLQKENDAIQVDQRASLQEALLEFTQTDFTFINCGGDDKTSQFREQWTDGANVFALAPGVIVGYERNTKTFNTLVDHGYSLMNQFEFVEEYATTDFVPSDNQKIAISFQGHELCRGRGGARCMTLPVSRMPIT